MNKVIIEYRSANKDEIIAWVFQNTKGRFCYDGVPEKRLKGMNIVTHNSAWTWYFENDDDAILFKLTWGGE